MSTFTILAPASLSTIPSALANATIDAERYDRLLEDVQRFRGAIYSRDGAIQISDLDDGRHRVGADVLSWHVLSMDSDDRISACVRYSEANDAKNLKMLYAMLGEHFELAVEWKKACAKTLRLSFGEVGGWAVAESSRSTQEALSVILATLGLLQLFGGYVGLATATTRHNSAAMLKRIGLRALSWRGVEIPAYFDAKYQCVMEVLFFDSRLPNYKYHKLVSELRHKMAACPVICRAPEAGGTCVV